MTENIPPARGTLPESRNRSGKTLLTEAVRHVDIVHISLAGLTAIIIMLLVAISLPVIGKAPVTSPVAFVVMVIVSVIGITGLYVLNYRVHKHVVNQALLTEVLVNSLGQGFLVFDKSGICGNVYSQACLDLLETVPANRHIADVLKVSQKDRPDFKEWISILFKSDHALGFDDVIRFLPSVFPHSQGRRISLAYRPIEQKEGELSKIVLIATDQTDEYEARQAAKKQQSHAEMICRIFKERNKYHATMVNLREFIDAAGTPTLGMRDGPPLMRQMHTLKAAVKHFNLFDLAEALHEAEKDIRSTLVVDDATFYRQLQIARQRISDAFLKTTDEVHALVGTEQEWRGNIREIEEQELYAFMQEMVKQNAPLPLMQHYLETIAAVPIRDCFHSFERELQELASLLDKQIKPVRFVGENPRILTQPIQDFLFSLTHISRNIMDHGIEAAVTRMARGKDPAGLVTVETRILRGESGAKWLYIAISDDGNGIDPFRIRAKLAALEPDGNWRFESDNAVIQRVFSWGFSTRDDVSMVSGQGVGLEAVEREVKLLGGTIRVSSELYKGARFEIRIPYRMDINQVIAYLDSKNLST